jgi:HlyD family secretion protein
MVPRRQLTIAARVIVLVAIAVAAVATLSNCSSSDKAASPSIATVERASFSTGIASTGSLTPLAEQNLGFAKGGELTSVLVKVGDHVDAGQTLATIDAVPARQAIAAQTAQLRSQEASLDKLKDSPNVDGAKDSLSQAKDVRDAVKRQVDAQSESDEAAIRSARQQVANDQQSADNAKSAQDSACGMWASSASCASAQSNTMSAQQKLSASQSALRAAEQKRDSDRASGQVSIETAQQSVVTARNSVDLSRSDRPHAIDQQEALVDAAKASVAQARHDLDNTTLRAPAAGTVTALNGAVGEYVSPSSGTSALAPGSDATLPGVSGATSGGSANSAAALAGGGPARPGGTQFLVLSDIDQFQVVASFNETDAAALTPDESVQVTFDAIPDLTTSGRVLSVSPSGTAVSGVISYYVTVAIEADDPRLKGGQTANVTVATSERSNVLTVPSSAVRRINGHSEVTVADGTSLRKVTFEAGAVGADRTEVVSGLREGQRVVLPVRQQGEQK